MILKGQKVILRPVKMDDAPRFVKWFNDAEVNKFLNLRKVNLIDEKKWVKQKIKNKNSGDLFFCIDTKEGVHIGTVALEAIHNLDKRAVFGIMIGEKDYWNNGYGTDAAKVILNYGFKKLKLHRIQLDVYSFNKRAVKVYKRIGFRLEGVMRDHVRFEGKYYSAYLMSMLESEWNKTN